MLGIRVVGNLGLEKESIHKEQEIKKKKQEPIRCTLCYVGNL